MSVEELRAENRYLLTEDLFREGMDRVYRDSLGPLVGKTFIVLAVLWAVLAVVTVSVSGKVVFALVEFLVLAAAGWTVARAIPRSRTKRAWEALQSRSGGETQRRVRFFERRLEIDPGERRVSYEDIDKVLETKRLLVLITRERIGIIVTKDGFTRGSLEDAEKLVNEWRK